MRIIAGIHKRRTIIAPIGDATRPTSDRARESLFNVLVHNFDLEGANVLDLFAGSGAFGLEALSRGAARATFVERDASAVAALRANTKAFGVESITHIAPNEVYKWFTGTKGAYDFVFADPPYDDERTLSELPSKLFASGLLLPQSLVIIEHRTGSIVSAPEGVEAIKEIAAGEAHFTILRSILNS